MSMTDVYSSGVIVAIVVCFIFAITGGIKVDEKDHQKEKDVICGVVVFFSLFSWATVAIILFSWLVELFGKKNANKESPLLDAKKAYELTVESGKRIIRENELQEQIKIKNAIDRILVSVKKATINNEYAITVDKDVLYLNEIKAKLIELGYKIQETDDTIYISWGAFL